MKTQVSLCDYQMLHAPVSQHLADSYRYMYNCPITQLFENSHAQNVKQLKKRKGYFSLPNYGWNVTVLPKCGSNVTHTHSYISA